MKADSIIKGILISLISLIILWWGEKKRNNEVSSLQSKQLTEETDGVIYNIGRYDKKIYTVYCYKYEVNDEELKDCVTANKQKDYIEGDTVRILYVKNNPSITKPLW